MARKGAGPSLRWGAEQRLEFIEFRAYWDGAVNRADITERFGVSVPQASNDISHYRELAPGNLDYDLSAKRYVPSAHFRPRFLKPNPEHYIRQLYAAAEGIIDLADTWIGNPPDIAVMPVPSRRIDATLFRSLLTVIRQRQSVEARYQSMAPQRPDAEWRRITPHAFATDGLRWHLRGFCHIDRSFKDFVLSRMSGLRHPGPPGLLGDRDHDWGAVFEAKLVPNGSLSDGQRQAIAHEYSMPKGGAKLRVSHAMLYYLKKRLRLDMPNDPPSEKPIIIANSDAFEAALASAQGRVIDGDQ